MFYPFCYAMWPSASIFIYRKKETHYCTGSLVIQGGWVTNDQMTGKHFVEGLRNCLLPNVPQNSLIIMDNTSHHSKWCEDVPGQKQEWLSGLIEVVHPPKAEIFSIYRDWMSLTNTLVKWLLKQVMKLFVFLWPIVCLIQSWLGHRSKATSRWTIANSTSMRLQVLHWVWGDDFCQAC